MKSLIYLKNGNSKTVINKEDFLDMVEEYMGRETSTYIRENFDPEKYP